jgi:hypothetical protein
MQRNFVERFMYQYRARRNPRVRAFLAAHPAHKLTDAEFEERVQRALAAVDPAEIREAFAEADEHRRMRREERGAAGKRHWWNLLS